jgi:hypothetical protein
MHPRKKQLKASELVSTIEELLTLDDVTVDARFEDDQTRRRLFSDVAYCCEQAYKYQDAQSLFDVQHILYSIYKLHLEIPRANTNRPECSAVLTGVRNLIEKHFLEYEESLIPAQLWENIPRSAPEYKVWLLRAVEEHPAYQHPLYEEYLCKHACLNGLRNFLIQETTIDSRFDDFLALVQLGTQDGIKLEIASNYWDEMGNGVQARMHTVMFNQTMSHLNIGPDVEEALTTEALVCGNLSLMLSLRRRYFYRAVGYFMVTEYLAPRRFQNVLEAWVRNGLRMEDAEYHRAHVAIDEAHADHWFDNVIKPVIERDLLAADEITRGAFCRLNTSQRYLDALNGKLVTQV